jgi:hypothetical protein
MYQFLDELKVIGEAMKDIPNLKQINDVIRNKCQEFLSKQNVQTAETILPQPANGAKALTDKGHTQCLKCKKIFPLIFPGIHQTCLYVLVLTVG